MSFDLYFFILNKIGETKRTQTRMLTGNVYNRYELLKLSAGPIPCDYKVFYFSFRCALSTIP